MEFRRVFLKNIRQGRNMRFHAALGKDFQPPVHQIRGPLPRPGLVVRAQAGQDGHLFQRRHDVGLLGIGFKFLNDFRFDGPKFNRVRSVKNGGHIVIVVRERNVDLNITLSMLS